MVRIAHFTDAAADGVNGIAASIRLLAGELAGRGHESLVVSAGPLWRDGRGDAWWMRSAPTGMGDFRWVLQPLRGMRDRVRDWRPDVAHVHTPGPLGAAAMTVARELGIPAVYTYHTDMHGYSRHYYIPTPVIRAGTAYFGRRLPPGAGARPGRRGGKYEAVEDANARIFEAARVIIVPTAAALRHCRTAAAYADRVRVVATPPSHRRTASAGQGAAFRARFGIAPDAPLVLFVGRVSVEKGIPLLLAAFARLRAETPAAVLVLAGPRSWRLRPRGLSNVVVTGTLRGDEVAAAYRAATVFAFPSLTDTQGIVLHEAALAGVPIVLVDPDLAAGHPLAAAMRLTDATPDALATALRGPFGDSAALGRRLAAELTPEVFAERTLAVYRAALTPAAATG